MTVRKFDVGILNLRARKSFLQKQEDSEIEEQNKKELLKIASDKGDFDINHLEHIELMEWAAKMISSAANGTVQGVDLDRRIEELQCLQREKYESNSSKKDEALEFSLLLEQLVAVKALTGNVEWEAKGVIATVSPTQTETRLTTHEHGTRALIDRENPFEGPVDHINKLVEYLHSVQHEKVGDEVQKLLDELQGLANKFGPELSLRRAAICSSEACIKHFKLCGMTSEVLMFEPLVESLASQHVTPGHLSTVAKLISAASETKNNAVLDSLVQFQKGLKEIADLCEEIKTSQATTDSIVKGCVGLAQQLKANKLPLEAFRLNEIASQLGQNQEGGGLKLARQANRLLRVAERLQTKKFGREGNTASVLSHRVQELGDVRLQLYEISSLKALLERIREASHYKPTLHSDAVERLMKQVKLAGQGVTFDLTELQGAVAEGMLVVKEMAGRGDEEASMKVLLRKLQSLHEEMSADLARERDESGEAGGVGPADAITWDISICLREATTLFTHLNRCGQGAAAQKVGKVHDRLKAGMYLRSSELIETAVEMRTLAAAVKRNLKRVEGQVVDGFAATLERAAKCESEFKKMAVSDPDPHKTSDARRRKSLDFELLSLEQGLLLLGMEQAGVEISTLEHLVQVITKTQSWPTVRTLNQLMRTGDIAVKELERRGEKGTAERVSETLKRAKALPRPKDENEAKTLATTKSAAQEKEILKTKQQVENLRQDLEKKNKLLVRAKQLLAAQAKSGHDKNKRGIKGGNGSGRTQGHGASMSPSYSERQTLDFVSEEEAPGSIEDVGSDASYDVGSDARADRFSVLFAEEGIQGDDLDFGLQAEPGFEDAGRCGELFRLAVEQIGTASKDPVGQLKGMLDALLSKVNVPHGGFAREVYEAPIRCVLEPLGSHGAGFTSSDEPGSSLDGGVEENDHGNGESHVAMRLHWAACKAFALTQRCMQLLQGES